MIWMRRDGGVWPAHLLRQMMKIIEAVMTMKER